MRVILIHQYYKTPEDGGAIRSYYIANHLVDLGHQVDVVTAYNKDTYLAKKHGNLTVHYLPVYYSNHLSFMSRVHAFYRFVTMAIKLIGKLQPADLNYVITTPLTTGLIALYAKRKFGTPYYFEVGDLWPDAPVQLGVLKNVLLKKMAYQLEKISYQSADELIALSPDIQKGIYEKVPDRSVEVITNFADVSFFSKEQKNLRILQKYDLEGAFVISYIGTVGIANHLEYLLDVAEAAIDNERIQFVVAGSGARWTSISTLAEKRSLTNIRFIDFLNKEGVRELMNITDAVFISFDNVPVLSTGSPNKFFDGLAAGKLIITNFGGWISKLIEAHQCGFSYHPDRPEEFLRQVVSYMNDNKLLDEAQRNSRNLASQFSPEVQLDKLTKLLSR